jgi:hypothetical protein
LISPPYDDDDDAVVTTTTTTATTITITTTNTYSQLLHNGYCLFSCIYLFTCYVLSCQKPNPVFTTELWL